MEIFRHLQEKKQQFEALEKEKQRALSLHDQDSVMTDIDHETFPGRLLNNSHIMILHVHVYIGC